MDVVEHGVARVALADVEAGVGAARGVGVLEHAVDRIEGVDAVVAVAVGREVRAAVAVDPGPEEAVERVVAGGHVLDRHAVGAEHADAVVELELAVEDHLVAIEAADRQLRSRDVDRFVVRARRHEDEIAWRGGVDRFLDRGVVGGHRQRGAARGGRRWFGRRRRSARRRRDRHRNGAEQGGGGDSGSVCAGSRRGDSRRLRCHA